MQVHRDSSRRRAEPAERPRRVLVVDDDPGIRALYSAVLGAEGHQVSEAANGLEGLERAVADRPDLVLLDLKMPVLDGFELAVALRKDSRTRTLPFVFVSGEPEPEVEGHAADVGALGYVAKPFDPTALAELVNRLLAQLDPNRR